MSDAWFQGKVAIVTGGSRGIGAATARWLAARGAHVVAASRSGDFPEGAEKPSSIRGFAADMEKNDSVDALFAFCDNTFGALDILVNNAAVIDVAPFTELSDAQWRRMFDINVFGMAHACREAFRRMKPGSAIVNIGSIAGSHGREKFYGFSAYSASKAAVAALSEALSVEGRARGIRVNCVAPGAVDTAMLRQAAPGLQTSAKPEDIAETIGFLCDGSRAAVHTGGVIEVLTNG
ncbi:MAG: SDR family oxidoreductase [Alphaproteobacteria bacterium]|nr:SDR family oxidoreductase [Alphaproteobacteria bacterium]